MPEDVEEKTPRQKLLQDLRDITVNYIDGCHKFCKIYINAGLLTEEEAIRINNDIFISLADASKTQTVETLKEMKENN